MQTCCNKLWKISKTQNCKRKIWHVWQLTHTATFLTGSVLQTKWMMRPIHNMLKKAGEFASKFLLRSCQHAKRVLRLRNQWPFVPPFVGRLDSYHLLEICQDADAQDFCCLTTRILDAHKSRFKWYPKIFMSVIPCASCRVMDPSSELFQTSLMQTAGFGYTRFSHQVRTQVSTRIHGPGKLSCTGCTLRKVNGHLTSDHIPWN